MRQQSQVEAENAYNQRQEDLGFVKVGVRVPKAHVEAIKQIAKSMREKDYGK